MERRHFMQVCLAAGMSTTVSTGARAGEAMTSGGEQAWQKTVAGYRRAWLDMLGPFPDAAPDLNPQITPRDDLEPGIQCRHVRFQTEPDDAVTAYLLIPACAGKGPWPAVICPHSTTHGAGKDRIVGLAGAAPGDPPDPPAASRAYGLELARWGYITLCIDLYGDGERIPPGLTHYNTTAFYEKHPEWSAMGKIVWDVMRSVDFLLTLDVVDPKRIACLGHSLGGQTTLFSAAFDARIAAAVTNGGMLSWVRDTGHWARPPDPEGRPVSSWIYIPRFRPYIDDPDKPIPIDFEHLMMMAAPRPLLIMSSENEMKQHDTIAKAAQAAEVYRQHGAGDRITLFSYPGGHNYPPVAKRHSFNWLDRWFGHTPALPTIWPGQAV